MDGNGNFQADGKKQGDWFEKTSQEILQSIGFTIDGVRERFADAGVEVDIIATNKHGISFYITCKGSWQGDRPGARRTDTFKKAISEALMLHMQGWGPVLLLTSHKPSTPAGLAMLANIDPEIMFDVIDPINDSKRLQWLASATEDALRQDLRRRRSLFLVAKPQRGFTTFKEAINA